MPVGEDLITMKRTRITEHMKIAASFLLLICIVLPFTSCTYQLDEDGKPTYISKKPGVQVVTKYEYPLEDLNLKRDWYFLLCFIWPIPILMHRYIGKRERLKLLFWLMEPLLLGFSSYLIYFRSTFLATPAIGAYLMQVAYAIYGTAWISEAIIKFLKRRRGFLKKSS